MKTAALQKSPSEVARLRDAGRVARFALEAALAAVRPGVTTREVDAVAERAIRERGATPEFLGYRGYPAATCISVNEEVVHGIPGDRVIREGDVVSVDVGARLAGWVGDNAATVVVGTGDPADRRLNETARECLERAVAACRAGGRLSDVVLAVQTHARSCGYGLVSDYGGHGIGTRLHEDPRVPNVVDEALLREDMSLEEGLCIAIEPMLVAGRPTVRTLADGWTVVTRDRSRAVHWEDVVAVTSDGPVVLTRP